MISFFEIFAPGCLTTNANADSPVNSLGKPTTPASLICGCFEMLWSTAEKIIDKSFKGQHQTLFVVMVTWMFAVGVRSYWNCTFPTIILNWVNWTPFGNPVVPDEHKISITFSFIFCGLHLNSFIFECSNVSMIWLKCIGFVVAFVVLSFVLSNKMICSINERFCVTALTLFKIHRWNEHNFWLW